MEGGSFRFSEDLAARVGVALASLARHFGFLYELGYAGPWITGELNSFDEKSYDLGIEFFSSSAQRLVRMGIHFGPDEKSQWVGVLIFWKMRRDDTHSQGGICFDRFVAKFRRDIPVHRLDMGTYEGPYAERMDKVLSLHAEILRTNALDILKGERWEKGLGVVWDPEDIRRQYDFD